MKLYIFGYLHRIKLGIQFLIENSHELVLWQILLFFSVYIRDRNKTLFSL